MAIPVFPALGLGSKINLSLLTVTLSAVEGLTSNLYLIMTPEFWIAHADSLFHQIFMLFMGGLYALAMLAGVTLSNHEHLLLFCVLSSLICLVSEVEKEIYTYGSYLIVFCHP